MKTRTKILTAGLACAALTGGVGASLASADTPSPSPSASPGSTSTATPDRKAGTHAKHRSLPARALHGTATLGGKKKQHVVDFQRGTVSKVSSTSVTVVSVDGFTATYRLDAGTKVRKDKAVATVAAVKTADRVVVRARATGTQKSATVIRDRGPQR